MTTMLAPPSARVALTAFNRIARAWELKPDEAAKLLGRSGRTATYRYRPGSSSRASSQPGRLDANVLERISLLLGIYEDLRLLFGRGKIADQWLRRPHRDFGERPPLERMLAGNVSDVYVVRRYLAVARQGIAPGAA